jgi:hypothetical protein
MHDFAQRAFFPPLLLTSVLALTLLRSLPEGKGILAAL